MFIAVSRNKLLVFNILYFDCRWDIFSISWLIAVDKQNVVNIAPQPVNKLYVLIFIWPSWSFKLNLPKIISNSLTTLFSSYRNINKKFKTLCVILNIKHVIITKKVCTTFSISSIRSHINSGAQFKHREFKTIREWVENVR